MENVNPLTLLPTPPSAEIPKAPKSVRTFIHALWDKAVGFANQFKSSAKRILFLEKQNSDLTAENKSLKRENDKLNAQVVDLQKENKALRTEVDSLTEENKQLKNKQNKNSDNSNTPPSKNPLGYKKPKKDSDKKGNKKSGEKPDASKDKKQDKPKKAKHPGAVRPLLPPTEEVPCYPTVCPHCGGNHFDDLHKTRVFQHIELPEQPLEVRQFDIYEGTCPCCGKIAKGSVPEEFSSAYGPRLTAFIAQLDSQTGTTRRQIQEIMLDVFGLPISLGALQNIVYRVSDAILPHYEVIAAGARESLFNHVDETSWRTHGPVLGKLLHWLWVLGNPYVAFFMVAPTRSNESYKNLIKDWKGLLISDDYAVYKSWDGPRQTCLAHMLREAKGLAESVDEEEAKCGKRILALLKYIMSFEDKPPPKNFLTSLDRRTSRLFKDFGDLPGKAGGLVLRIYKNLETLTLFLRNALASKTNNFAEGLVRTAVCQRKISIGSASDRGERWIERSLSLRKTCALNGQSYFKTLASAISCAKTKGRPKLYWLRKACAKAKQRYAMESAVH